MKKNLPRNRTSAVSINGKKYVVTRKKIAFSNCNSFHPFHKIVFWQTRYNDMF